jgi:hypothetical protein
MRDPHVVLGAVQMVTIVLAVLVLTIRMRGSERRVSALVRRVTESLQDRGRTPKEKQKGDDLEPLRQELQKSIDALRLAVANLRAEAERRRNAPESRPPQFTSMPAWKSGPKDDGYDDPRTNEDGAAQLLTIANRIVQQGSTSLDTFRGWTGALADHVSAWSPEGTLAAFIVEHRGTCYVVPNVLKPTRLKSEWFNRSAFGFNDEIRRVISLPRLRRRGDELEVEEQGVFEK